MTHYTSTTQGVCARCGERTTRSKLCRACGRDEHREANLTDTEPAGPPLYECVDCGGDGEFYISEGTKRDGGRKRGVTERNYDLHP